MALTKKSKNKIPPRKTLTLTTNRTTPSIPLNINPYEPLDIHDPDPKNAPMIPQEIKINNIQTEGKETELSMTIGMITETIHTNDTEADNDDVTVTAGIGTAEYTLTTRCDYNISILIYKTLESIVIKLINACMTLTHRTLDNTLTIPP